MLLTIQDLDVAYGERQVLNKVCLKIEKQTIVGIVGESGSGKSTLLNSILRLLGQSGHILNGQILLRETDILRCDQKKLREIRGGDVSMIFQDPTRMLDPMERIGHLYLEIAKVHRDSFSRRKTIEAAEKMLEMVGFEDVRRIMRSYPYELSGGMNQRAAIGAALINTPYLLLADEPTSALDVRSQMQIMELLKTINEKGTAILFATHNMGLVANLANYIGVMLKGQIIEYGTCDEVLKNPKHEYTKMLISSVLTLKSELPESAPFEYERKGYGEKIFVTETHWFLQNSEAMQTGDAEYGE